MERDGRDLKVSPAAMERAASGRRLPCLSSNNSTEGAETPPSADADLAFRLPSSQHRKSAVALALNVQHLADRMGIERLGFLTLTFADHVRSPREAQRRFNSLRTHVLAVRYDAHIRVFERQRSGRVHYHLLVALKHDVRTGVDFEEFAAGTYRTAGQHLRSEWAWWREHAKSYGFGRTELMPIRSTSEGIGRYVGKYIGKHVAKRIPEDRGVRLVEYSRGARIATTRFGWATPGAASWRRKLAVFAAIVAERRGVDSISFSDLSVHLGPRWAHRHRDFIAALPDAEV